MTIAIVALAVGACTTSNDDGNLVEETLSVPGAAQAVDPNAGGNGVTAQAFAANAARVHFAPIVGAPVDKVTALSRQLSASGPDNNIRLEPARTRGIDHEIRGYFSALSESGTTTVIHVWDVFTPNGQRVHRIQGQERVSGASADPWAGVPASVMEQIADRVLSEYASWRGQTA